MKNKRVIFLLFLLLFGLAGYFRERFFEHMNIILASVYRGTDEYAIVHQQVPFIMEPMLHWSYPTLYYSKYLFTLLWTALFFILNRSVLFNTTSPKGLFKILNITYVLLLMGAAISMLLGYLVNGTLKNDEYTFSRWLLGIAQSPIICLILLASVKLFNHEKQHDQ